MCTASPEKKEHSDARRMRLVEIMYAMNDEDMYYDQTVELIKEFVAIVDEERLVVKVGEYYDIFMKVFAAYNDIESALHFGRLALKHAETFADPEGTFCTRLRENIELLERRPIPTGRS